MKEAFPSNGEREVASALLLLSAISSSPLPKSDCITANSHKVALSNSNSKSKSKVSSILTSVDCSFDDNRSQSRRMNMIATFCDQTMKLKLSDLCISDLHWRFSQVVRQELLHFDCRKMSSGKPASATTSRTTFCRSTAVSASFLSCELLLLILSFSVEFIHFI
ncbi:hypothetical protein R3W88_028153 [Solanum pinnatisectum]|uniref:Uncharacterized protein n=1 Tax=Solanum pinnatisectum TaxID=50273 RepID=A0AAV9LL72_9SOLN|nr:hypothetical protein R3W88_028153 [Solanum pinnatisectum]